MSESQQPNQERSVTLPVARRMLWVWTALLVAPWVLLAVTLGPQWVSQCAQNWRLGKRNGNDDIHYCQRGPWGEVEYTRVVIEPPEAFVAMSFDPDKKIRWVLHGYNAQTLAQLWTEANLGATEQQALMASARWENGTGTVVIEPSRELVLNLTQAARVRLYKTLSEFPENHNHMHPFRFRANVVDEWFADSDITDRTEQLIRRMLYPRGTSLLFADLDALLPMLGTAKERARAVKTLCRISTLLVKLRVRPNTDIEEVARYWGRGRRSKDITPLLASLPKKPEGYTVDVAHLLPAFARRRLYTYPNPDTDPNTLREDCHWTSMNFFSEVPDNRFLSTDYTYEVIMKDYYPVVGEPLFGDIVLLMTANGQALHSCVYVADDIVFTKNGSQAYMPWKLMELSDVRAFYSMEPPLKVQIIRYKHW